MKKFRIAAGAIMLAGLSLTLNSCIGNFALTNKVLSWNKQVGNKFVNELVFFAFWVLPVYEVTVIADALVLNSIEFWSGSNPLQASVTKIETEQGRYIIDCDGKGYTVTHEKSGQSMRLDFIEEEQTWALNDNGYMIPFMTFVDDTHVKMIMPEGESMLVELSQGGVMAYHNAADVIE